MRFLSFNNSNEMKEKLPLKKPVKIDIGAIYNIPV